MESDDTAGWETVHRGGRTRTRSNPTKLTSPLSQTTSNHDVKVEPQVVPPDERRSGEKASVGSTRGRSEEKENQPTTEYETNQLNICECTFLLLVSIYAVERHNTIFITLLVFDLED